VLVSGSDGQKESRARYVNLGQMIEEKKGRRLTFSLSALKKGGRPKLSLSGRHVEGTFATELSLIYRVRQGGAMVRRGNRDVLGRII